MSELNAIKAEALAKLKDLRYEIQEEVNNSLTKLKLIEGYSPE